MNRPKLQRWLKIASIVLGIIPLFVAGGNAVQMSSNVMRGSGTSIWDVTALTSSGGVAAFLMAVVPMLLNSFWPKSDAATQITEAITALTAWAQDPSNPKRMRNAIIELLDVAFYLLDYVPNSEQVKQDLRDLSKKIMDRLGPGVEVNVPDPKK